MISTPGAATLTPLADPFAFVAELGWFVSMGEVGGLPAACGTSRILKSFIEIWHAAGTRGTPTTMPSEQRWTRPAGRSWTAASTTRTVR